MHSAVNFFYSSYSLGRYFIGSISKKMFSLIFKVVKWAFAAFLISTILAVIYYRHAEVRVTPLMVIRSVENLFDGKSPYYEHKWVPLSEMSKYMPVAVMASEDQNFLHHNGFDFDAIRQAAEERKETGRRRGASTITQQMVKNVYLWPSSTWVRKGFEAYFTVLVELMWPKERIMEVYLNSIEMGPSIYGVEAVAQQHFDCSASRLTRSDCALIAATLPNPRHFSSLRPTRYMRKRQAAIKLQMKHIPLLTKSDK